MGWVEGGGQWVWGKLEESGGEGSGGRGVGIYLSERRHDIKRDKEEGLGLGLGQMEWE